MRRARQYTTDYRGLSICTYNGRHRFAWARFLVGSTGAAMVLQDALRSRDCSCADVPGHLSPGRNTSRTWKHFSLQDQLRSWHRDDFPSAGMCARSSRPSRSWPCRSKVNAGRVMQPQPMVSCFQRRIPASSIPVLQESKNGTDCLKSVTEAVLS